MTNCTVLRNSTGNKGTESTLQKTLHDLDQPAWELNCCQFITCWIEEATRFFSAWCFRKSYNFLFSKILILIPAQVRTVNIYDDVCVDLWVVCRNLMKETNYSCTNIIKKYHIQLREASENAFFLSKQGYNLISYIIWNWIYVTRTRENIILRKIHVKRVPVPFLASSNKAFQFTQKLTPYTKMS